MQKSRVWEVKKNKYNRETIIMPFEPGKSGNPKGRPHTDAEIKELMGYTRNVLYYAMAKYITMSGEELVEVLKDKEKLPQIDRLIISCIVGARDKKDMKRLELLYYYILGKPKEVVQHDIEEIRVRLIKASEEAAKNDPDNSGK